MQYLYKDQYPGRESNVLEFKEHWSKEGIEKYRKTINSFMNARGGSLVFGVTDTGVIQGIHLPRDREDEIRLFIDNFLKEHTYPKFKGLIAVDTSRITVDLYLVHINIQRDSTDHPVYHLMEGHTFTRQSASSIPSDYCRFVPREVHDAELRMNESLREEIQELKDSLSDVKKERDDKSDEIKTLHITLAQIRKELDSMKKLTADPEAIELATQKHRDVAAAKRKEVIKLEKQQMDMRLTHALELSRAVYLDTSKIKIRDARKLDTALKTIALEDSKDGTAEKFAKYEKGLCDLLEKLCMAIESHNHKLADFHRAELQISCNILPVISRLIKTVVSQSETTIFTTIIYALVEKDPISAELKLLKSLSSNSTGVGFVRLTRKLRALIGRPIELEE